MFHPLATAGLSAELESYSSDRAVLLKGRGNAKGSSLGGTIVTMLNAYMGPLDFMKKLLRFHEDFFDDFGWFADDLFCFPLIKQNRNWKPGRWSMFGSKSQDLESWCFPMPGNKLAGSMCFPSSRWRWWWASPCGSWAPWLGNGVMCGNGWETNWSTTTARTVTTFFPIVTDRHWLTLNPRHFKNHPSQCHLFTFFSCQGRQTISQVLSSALSTLEPTRWMCQWSAATGGCWVRWLSEGVASCCSLVVPLWIFMAACWQEWSWHQINCSLDGSRVFGEFGHGWNEMVVSHGSLLVHVCSLHMFIEFLKFLIAHPRKLGWYRAWSQLTCCVTGSRQFLFPSLSTAVLSVGFFGVLLILVCVQARRGSPSSKLTYTPDSIWLGEWDMFFLAKSLPFYILGWWWCQSPLFNLLSQPILPHVIQWATNPNSPMYVTHAHISTYKEMNIHIYIYIYNKIYT